MRHLSRGEQLNISKALIEIVSDAGPTYIAPQPEDVLASSDYTTEPIDAPPANL
jgi:hypothetical protein